MRLIKINRQKEAGLVLQHRVTPYNVIVSIVIPARLMPKNDLFGHRKEATLCSIDTLDPGFLAYPTNPFISTSRLIPGFARLPTLEPTGIHIIPSPEKRPEQSNLGHC